MTICDLRLVIDKYNRVYVNGNYFETVEDLPDKYNSFEVDLLSVEDNSIIIITV